MNILFPPALIAFMSKITLKFFKQFKLSDSSNKTLEITSLCKNQEGPPCALNKKKTI